MNFPYSFWQSSYVTNLQSNALVAYYKLDNIGNTFKNSAGSGLNLTALQTPQLLPGVILVRPPRTSLVFFDSAFSCTGDNGMIDFSKNPNFQITGDKTFVLWHNSSLIPPPNTANNDTLLWNGGFGNISTNGTYAGSGGYQLFFQQDRFSNIYNKLTFQLQLTGTPGSVNLTISAHSGIFQFIAVIIDYKAGNVSLQVNNDVTGAITSSPWGSQNGSFLSAGAFIIGSAPYKNALGSRLFGSGNCLIDEVGVWNRKLTSGELTYLYNNGKGRTYPFNF